MTLKSYFAIFAFSFAALACTPKATTTPTTASAAGTSSVATNSSVASCGAVNGYNSMNECKTSSFAQCFPSDKNINGTNTTCYFPLEGSSACTATSAAWSYGNWKDWCIPTGMPAGTFQRSRDGTCTKSANACDCASAPESVEYCSLGNNYYKPCDFTTAPTQSCSTTPTPAPTAPPTPTPSQTAGWCANINLNYASNNRDSNDILKNLNLYHYGDISTYFRGYGYNIMYIHSQTPGVTPFPSLTTADLQHNYTVQISAEKHNCFIGKKVTVNVSLLIGGNNIPGNRAIATSSSTSSCVSFGDEAGRALNRALGDLNPPTCY